MLEKFLNIFRIPDLRKRVLFTLGILAVYRLGAWIPTPGVTPSCWSGSSTSKAVRRWA
jgi:preprotein translocase subunit SecY